MNKAQLKKIFLKATTDVTHDLRGYEKAKAIIKRYNLKAAEYNLLISQITEYLDV